MNGARGNEEGRQADKDISHGILLPLSTSRPCLHASFQTLYKAATTTLMARTDGEGDKMAHAGAHEPTASHASDASMDDASRGCRKGAIGAGVLDCCPAAPCMRERNFNNFAHGVVTLRLTAATLIST